MFLHARKLFSSQEYTSEHKNHRAFHNVYAVLNEEIAGSVTITSEVAPVTYQLFSQELGKELV